VPELRLEELGNVSLEIPSPKDLDVVCNMPIVRFESREQGCRTGFRAPCLYGKAAHVVHLSGPIPLL